MKDVLEDLLNRKKRNGNKEKIHEVVTPKQGVWDAWGRFGGSAPWRYLKVVISGEVFKKV